MKQNILFKKLEDSVLLIVKVGLAVAWATFIFAILERPMPIVESDAKGFTISDKLTHIFLFGILLWLALNAWREWPQQKQPLKSGFRGASAGRISRFGYWLMVALVFGFAYLCEYLQRFVPSRTSSLTDLSFGALGIVLSLLCYFFFQKKAPLRTGHMRIKKPKLLVHLCCGPCGSALSEELKEDYDVSLFFANSNLDSRGEFSKRANSAKKVAREYGLPIIIDNYDHGAWRELVRGLEDAPERGARCLACYDYRLKQTAAKAEELGFAYFTTSLSVSPHKDGQAIIHLGRTLRRPLLRQGFGGQEGYGGQTEIGDKLRPKFLDRHFGQSQGYKKSVAKAKELGLYRQKYCGCEFSRVPWREALRDKKQEK